MQGAIAVLPFEDLEGASRHTWFTRGFAEDLITELARFSSLEVIHAHSSFAVEADARSDASLGRELGARHLLRGSVRRVNDTTLVSARLVEAPTGRQLWAERFEVPAGELPALQIEIAAKVASALAQKLDDVRLQRARRRALADLEVYDCWLRGLDLLRGGTPEDDERARALFERALELDPHFARAHAGISLSHFNEWSCQAWEAWDETERLAFEAARRAADLDDSDHVVQIILGRIQLYRRQFEQAERHLDLALEINANDADALVQIALGNTYLGEAERALGLVAKAKRLNPKHGEWYDAFHGLLLFSLCRYEESIAQMERGVGATVDMPAFLAAAHAHAGEPGRAAARLEEFLATFREKILFGREPEPGEPLRWVLHVNPYRRPEDAEHLARGLALAGLAQDPDRAAPLVPARLEPTFRREADVWTLAWGGRTARLGGVKGFFDLAVLLQGPGEPVHCLELAGRPAPAADGEETVDARARAEASRRLRELQEELDLAEEHRDLARAERARAELDGLVLGLARALGIGGRSRKLGSAAEKARSAVTWRIRSALRRIAGVHPELGRHLENSVRTGTYCVYAPESPVSWRL